MIEGREMIGSQSLAYQKKTFNGDFCMDSGDHWRMVKFCPVDGINMGNNRVKVQAGMARGVRGGGGESPGRWRTF